MNDIIDPDNPGLLEKVYAKKMIENFYLVFIAKVSFFEWKTHVLKFYK